MAESEKNEILLAIEKLDNKMQKELSEIKREVAKIPEIQKEIAKIKKMQEDIAELQKETRKISKSVAVIELEHGEKLDLLFDIFDMQQEKLKSHERRIQLCERHLDRHDDEIYYLKKFLRV